MTAAKQPQPPRKTAARGRLRWSLVRVHFRRLQAHPRQVEPEARRRRQASASGWLLDQRPFLPHLRKPAPPVVLGPPKHRGWARYAHQRRAERAVRTSARPAEPKGTRAGGWRRTPTTGEAGTHPRREWPAPAPRASPGPFRRRLRLKGDGPFRSWRRETPGGLLVEQFAEQSMLNLDAT